MNHLLLQQGFVVSIQLINFAFEVTFVDGVCTNLRAEFTFNLTRGVQIGTQPFQVKFQLTKLLFTFPSTN